MKPHPRLRRAALVSGAVVSVLLVAVWIASAWWILGYNRGNYLWQTIQEGCFRVIHHSNPVYATRPVWTSWYVRAHSERLEWWFVYRRSAGDIFFQMPLWFPAALSVLATAAVWRLDARSRRRARVGACAKCGYDRSGLAPGAACPECGTPPPPPDHPPDPKKGEGPCVVVTPGPTSPGG